MAVVRPTKKQIYGRVFDLTAEDDNGNQIWDDLGIEMWCIKQSDEFRKSQGNTIQFHFENCRKILWPNLDDHRWHRVCRDEILNNKVTVLLGCGSSGKTHEAAWTYLLDYWCFPDTTCVLVCSTDIRGLKKRVWGEITMLWEEGIARFPKLSGHLLDSAIAITTDDIDDCEPGQRKTRDMRKGIFGVPCVQGGKFVGLSKFLGIKQKRMRLIADEASMMGENFLSAFANLNKNEDFRAIVLGNPNDPLDPLGRAAEPREGWTDDYLEPKGTRVWDTRFMGGRCVNLIGTNSPNFDFPADQPTRYKYLISREKIADTLSFFPKDSMEYYSQCVGSMKIGTIARRVLSRKLCIVNKAQEDVVWLGSDRIKVYFVDAAYGGDRCMAGWAEFGKAIDGVQILSFEEPKIIPILVGDQYPTPEYQIAEVVKEDCESNDIPGDCMGHDSTGRGALGTALAKVWSADTHPIDAGGRPTKRPVSLDITVLDEDTKQKRPKRCDEEYDRLTSEFNFQVSMAVESSQIRNLPEECMEEFCLRRWTRVKGDKKSVEPKDKQHADPEKKGFKQRVGRSPDAADWAAGIVEMARRKGFIITKLGAGIVGSDENKSRAAWLRRHAELTALNKSRQLTATT